MGLAQLGLIPLPSAQNSPIILVSDRYAPTMPHMLTYLITQSVFIPLFHNLRCANRRYRRQDYKKTADSHKKMQRITKAEKRSEENRLENKKEVVHEAVSRLYLHPNLLSRGE
jgi:hypothetical protein